MLLLLLRIVLFATVAGVVVVLFESAQRRCRFVVVVGLILVGKSVLLIIFPQRSFIMVLLHFDEQQGTVRHHLARRFASLVLWEVDVCGCRSSKRQPGNKVARRA